MGAFEVLLVWFLLSFTGAAAPGPLSAAVIQYSSQRGKLIGMLPMVGHAIVELGILAAVILSVQVLMVIEALTDIMVVVGGVVVILFGLLALRHYRHEPEIIEATEATRPQLTTALGATVQGATVSILSPYFLLWWFAIGFSSATMLMAELQVGVGLVFLAGALIYLTHISTDFIIGGVLTVMGDEVSKRATARDINWTMVAIGVFQILLGAWFIIQPFIPSLIQFIGL
ncbi:MAG: LysE family transporter [Candidatus Thorarchaeota archaeon]